MQIEQRSQEQNYKNYIAEKYKRDMEDNERRKRLEVGICLVLTHSARIEDYRGAHSNGPIAQSRNGRPPAVA